MPYKGKVSHTNAADEMMCNIVVKWMSVTDTEVGSAGHNIKVGGCVCVCVRAPAQEVAAFAWKEGSDLTEGGVNQIFPSWKYE